MQFCERGTRLQGCPALQAERVCVPCVYGAQQVQDGRAHWLANEPGAMCQWTCNEGYYYSEFEAICVVCAGRTACSVGQRWQACTNTTDAQCVSCPSLRVTKGEFGENEEYVAGEAGEDEAEECRTACKAGH